MSGYAYTPWIWPLLASAGLQLALAAYLWRRRRTRGALPLAMVLLVAAVWCLADAGELTATEVASKEAWFLVRDALALPGMTASLWFVLEYAGLERWLTRPVVVLLVGAVVVLSALYLIDDGHLLWIRLWWDGEVRGELGWVGVLFAIYGYAIAVLATGLLVLVFVRSPAHRVPVALIVVGQVGVRGAYSLGSLNIADVPSLASMAVAVDFSSLMYVVALFRFRLFDLVPVARETILQQIPDAMLVLDTQGRVVDVNAAGRRLLAASTEPRPTRIDADAGIAPPRLSDVLSRLSGPSSEIVLETSHGERTCQVTMTDLEDWQRQPIGRLVLLHDITDLRVAEGRLLEQERALAVAQERERLGRDLHDSLGQVLGYVGLQASSIRKLASDGRLEAVDERLDRLASVAGDAQADVRRTIAELARSAARDTDLLASLHTRLAAARRDFGIEASLVVAPPFDGTGIAPETASHLLRIVEEAIANAVRHGKAHSARVSLALDDGCLALSIEDDGVGFDSAAEAARGDGRDGGYGLRFMRERVAELGGDVKVASRPGEGTTVTARIPVVAPGALPR